MKKMAEDEGMNKLTEFDSRKYEEGCRASYGRRKAFNGGDGIIYNLYLVRFQKTVILCLDLDSFGIFLNNFATQ